MGVERVVDSADRLGECPLWDERERVLWWVDILAPAIKCFDGKLRMTAAATAPGASWVGTMKDPEHTPTGALYRFEKDGRRGKRIA
jgi:sugar lactone lactonase YvrE